MIRSKGVPRDLGDTPKPPSCCLAEQHPVGRAVARSSKVPGSTKVSRKCKTGCLYMPCQLGGDPRRHAGQRCIVEKHVLFYRIVLNGAQVRDLSS